MATTDKDVIYEGAFGKRDLGKPDAMTVDSVFWIASMTKAITATAAMQLVEQGKLSLDEPIGKVLPDLAAPKVFDGLDASGAPKLRDTKQPITLRHLPHPHGRVLLPHLERQHARLPRKKGAFPISPPAPTRR